MYRRVLLTCFLIILFATTTAFSQEAGTDSAATSSLKARLTQLEQQLEKARLENHIPGFAVGIVQDDKVIFAKGFGLANVDLNTPVQSTTRFAIGSTTKAFTSTLVAMLVDEQKMDWDDSVATHIPNFSMKVETTPGQITVQDVLSHRTGYTRMGILWANGKYSVKEVIEMAEKAEPYAKYQEKFLYNNVMFSAAGVCAGNACQSDWHSLIKQKIFQPLNMDRSTTRYSEMQSDPQMASGYQWDGDNQKLIAVKYRNVDGIAPAASICSSVDEMAQWIRFQLGRGRFQGKTILSEAQHAETWSAHTPMKKGVAYGLGWVLRQWNAEQVVEHGGSTNGYSAQVTLLPGRNTGYVVLSNVTTTPFHQESIGLIFDTLFNENPDQSSPNVAGPTDKADTASFVGSYVANFKRLNNAIVRIQDQDSGIAIQFPGQPAFPLQRLSDEGRWQIPGDKSAAFSFNKSPNGVVRSMSMHVGGVEAEFFREEYEPEPEVPTEITAPMIGTYRDEESGNEITIEVRKGRLVVDGGRSAFEFLPPDEDGNWAMRARPDRIQIRFNRGEDGNIKSLTRIVQGKATEMPLVQASVEPSLPTSEELYRKVCESYGQFENDIAGVRFRGSANFLHQGASGKVTTLLSRTGQYYSRRDFGELGHFASAFDGKKGDAFSSFGRYEILEGRKLNVARNEYPLWFLKSWEGRNRKVRIQGTKEVDGQKTFVVMVSDENTPDRKIYVSEDSGMVLREEMTWIIDAAGELPVEVSYSDFRNVAGVQIPFRVVAETPILGQIIVLYDSVELLSKIDNGSFSVAHPDKQ